MAKISAPGIGSSNFDLSGLLTQLKEYESQPLAILQQAQKSTQTQISAYGSLRSAVTTIQNAGNKLAKPETFTAVTAAVTGTGFTATADQSAIAAQYSVKVERLAEQHVLQSARVGDRNAAIGSGGTVDIALTDGSTQSISLGEAPTLPELVKAINANDKAGVSASMVSDGQGGTYLMLSAKTSGTAAAIGSITVTGNDAMQDLIGFGAGASSGLTEQTAASDAQLTVNGIAVTASSNVVTGVIGGVTLTLTEAGQAAGSLKLTPDTTAAKTAVTEFVNAYNALQNVIGNLTSYDATAGTGSTLTADSTTRNIQDALSQTLRFSTSEGDLRSMGQMGITTDPKTGRLSIDTTKLDDALKQSPSDVSRVFSGPGGLGERLDTATKTILGDGTKLKGSIDARRDALEKLAKSQQKNYEATALRIESTMATYEMQFTALSKSLAMFESTQNYLTTQFESMTKSK